MLGGGGPIIKEGPTLRVSAGNDRLFSNLPLRFGISSVTLSCQRVRHVAPRPTSLCHASTRREQLEEPACKHLS